MPKNARNSNFEWLKIISIFFIIAFHYSLKGGWIFDIGSSNQIVKMIILILGELGVNLFMLITGYYMIEHERRLNKVIRIACVSIFYTFLFSCVLNRCGMLSFRSVETWKRILLSDILNTYWYVTVYIMIYIFSPYMNAMIRALDQKKLAEFLTIGLLLWCVLPSFLWIENGTTEELLYYNRFLWLALVYCIGAYIRLYDSWKLDKSVRRNFVVAANTFAIMVIGIFITQKIEMLAYYHIVIAAGFWPPNTVLMVLLSISLFNIFRLLKMKQNKLVNLIAGTTLGVYIIHDGMLRQMIWAWIKVNTAKSGVFFIDLIVGTIVTFVIAATIDMIRQLFDRCIRKLCFKKV